MEGHEFDQKTAELVPVSAIGRMLNPDAAKWIRRLECEIPQRKRTVSMEGRASQGRKRPQGWGASVGGLVRLFGLVGPLRPFN